MRLCVILLFGLFCIQQVTPPPPSKQTNIEKGDAQKEKQDAADKGRNQSNISASGGSAVKKPETDPNKRQAYDAGQDTLYRIYLWATIVGVIGAVCGIGVISRQTKFLRRGTVASEQAVTLAARNFRVQHRAWVSAWAQVMERTEKSIDIRVHSKNTGATPALNVSTQFGHVLKNRDYVLESDFAPEHVKISNPDKRGSRSVIPPNEFIISPTFAFNLITDKDAAIDKESWLFICGTITYDDIFGDSHTTLFCQRVEGKEMVWANAHNYIG